MGLLADNELAKLLRVMTDGQIAFAESYIISLNGTKSAIAAGYSKKTAKTQASRLLSNANVQKYIQHLKSRRSIITEVTAERVVLELAKIAFQDAGDYIDFDGKLLKLKNFGTLGDKTKNIKKIKITDLKDAMNMNYGQSSEIELYDKMKALELLGRHTAIFTDKIDLLSGGEKFEQPQHVVNIVVNHRAKNEKLSTDETN